MLKVHGSKNTFYLIDQGEFETLKKSKINFNKYVQDLCLDGTDGVLVEEASQVALSKMRIFNADGMEPEMCGNGLRCFARYILEKFNLKSGLIETMLKTYQVDYIEDFYGQIGISLLLNSIKDCPYDHLTDFKDLFSDAFRGYNVSNPHLVCQTKVLFSKNKMLNIGKKAQNVFVKGINVNTYQVLDGCNIYVRTFERGVGVTAACGTGMTACAVDFAKSYLKFNKNINVFSDGGLVSCKVNCSEDGYDVEFTGNATMIGEYLKDGSFKVFSEENHKYEMFYKNTRAMIHKYNI